LTCKHGSKLTIDGSRHCLGGKLLSGDGFLLGGIEIDTELFVGKGSSGDQKGR
jgi:hypothetical protein